MKKRPNSKFSAGPDLTLVVEPAVAFALQPDIPQIAGPAFPLVKGPAVPLVVEGPAIPPISGSAIPLVDWNDSGPSGSLRPPATILDFRKDLDKGGDLGHSLPLQPIAWPHASCYPHGSSTPKREGPPGTFPALRDQLHLHPSQGPRLHPDVTYPMDPMEVLDAAAAATLATVASEAAATAAWRASPPLQPPPVDLYCICCSVQRKSIKEWFDHVATRKHMERYMSSAAAAAAAAAHSAGGGGLSPWWLPAEKGGKKRKLGDFGWQLPPQQRMVQATEDADRTISPTAVISNPADSAEYGGMDIQRKPCIYFLKGETALKG